MVQCSTCELVIREVAIGRMKPINCRNCGKFLAYAEEIAGFASSGRVKCKKCGAPFTDAEHVVLAMEPKPGAPRIA